MGLQLHVEWILEVLELLDSIDRRERVLVVAVVRPERLELIHAQRTVVEPDAATLEVGHARLCPERMGARSCRADVEGEVQRERGAHGDEHAVLAVEPDGGHRGGAVRQVRSLDVDGARALCTGRAHNHREVRSEARLWSEPVTARPNDREHDHDRDSFEHQRTPPKVSRRSGL